MANYDARINISADNRPAIAAINEIQNRFDRLNRAAQVDFGERVRLGGLERSLRTVNQIENAVISLNAQLRSLSAPGAGAIGDAFRVAGQRANNFFDGLARGDRFLSNSIAGLNEQSRAFATLAANINSAERRFTDYVQGAQAAQDAGLRPLFRQFEALRRLYQEGVTGMGSGIQSQQIGIPFFESLRNEIPNTTKALQTYRAELERIQSLVESGSAIDLGIQQELIRVERELLDIETQRLEVRSALRAETSAEVQASLSRMEGRTADPFSRPDEQINDLLDQRAEQYVLQQRELASLQQVLSSMEGKKYDPLNISDEQINSGLNERATQYQKQLEELTSLQQVLSSMEGKKYDPLNISDEQINQGLNERAAQYQVQRAELAALRNSLASMEGKKYDPFGISDQQINSSLDERASTYERQVRESEILQRALGDLERRRVDWTSALGINEADLAADNAARLEAEWNKLQSAADRLASNASEAAAALRAFEFQTRARDAEAYTRALLNQQRALDEYADSANTASRAASGLGYSGELPALRPAGFTNQDVRIKNLVDDQAKAIRINSELEIELDKIATFAAIDNIQREYDYEIDKIEDTLRARIKADEEFWAASKRNLDEADARAKDERDRAAKPFLEQRFGKRGSAAISEGLVGGAFPLLFGQGLGASVGGGLGGALGGFAGGGLGFGLSLLGTGLGTAFDATIAAATELGGALNDLSSTFEVVKNRALFSSRETEKLASKLEEAGLVASASILAQEEVIRKIGTSGVRDLKNLETASDRLSRAWAEFTLQLQVALAGPMAGLLEWVTSIVAASNERRVQAAEVRSVYENLSPEDKKEYDKRVREIFFPSMFDPNRATSREEAIRRQLELTREFAPRARRNRVAADPSQSLSEGLAGAETLVNALNAKLSALDLGKSLIDQVKNATQEQEDLDRQRAKAVEDYERAIGDIRLGVERRVTQERLNNLAKENEIYSKQGDIRLQQLKNENAIARESLRGNDLGQQLFDIVAQYSEEQLATENEIANRRRSLEAELQSVAIETEQYKVDVAKQVADLNRSTAEQVQQIQLSTARKQDQSARNRFELEKQIAIAQIKVQELSAKQEARKLETLIKAEQDAGVKADLQASLDIYKGFFEGGGANPFTALENQVKGLKPPAALSYAGFNVGQGVSTAGFDAVIAAGNQLRLRLEELSRALDSLVAAGKFNEFNSQLMNLADQGMMAAVKEFKELSASLELVTGGSAGLGALLPQFEALDEAQKKILGSEAVQKSPQKAELEKLIPLYIRLAKVNMQAAETYGFFNSAISENLSEITSLKEEINNLLAGTTAYEQALASLTARGLSPASEEAQKLLASAQELDRLRDKAEILNNIRDAATGFSDSLRGLVEQFVELRDAGEAVKAFSEELGKKSLSFVLDLAFKPIEDAMQKQFIAFADMLGVDVRPEELKQLTELQKIENWTRQINDAIKPIADSLAASQKQAEAEAAARAAQVAEAERQAGAYLNATEQKPPFAPGGPVPRNLPYWLPAWGDPTGGASDEELKRRYEGKTIGAVSPQFTGIGGPNIPESQMLYPGPDKPGYMPRSLTPTVVPLTVQPYGSQSSSANSAAQETSAAIDTMTAEVYRLPVALEGVTGKINASTTAFQSANESWVKGLGQAVTGLAGAAAAAVGIAGGVQQMSDGGTYNTLTGLAGIFGGLAAVAGAAGSLSGAFGAPKSPDVPDAPSAPFDPGAPAAPKAAGGSVLGGSPYLVGEQGPELFIPSGNGMIIPNRSSKVERNNNPFAATSQQVSANGERAMTANIDNSPIRVESRIINGVEYVTMDQLNEATLRAEKRGAERGKTLAISSLQNSVKTRKRVGV